MIEVRDRYDITGHKFNHIVVLWPSHHDERGSVLWLCRCICGVEFTVPSSRLRNGRTRSCGCRKFENIGHRKMKHGKAKRGSHDNRQPAREYDAWTRMIRRCTNPRDSQYARYGGRGITVCARWMDSVESFIADMGQRPSPIHSLDRIDNDRGYEPGNCRWATATEQANNRRTNLFIEIDGKRQTLAEWSRSSGMDPRTLRRRIAVGMDPKEALTKPLRKVDARRGGGA